MLKTFMAHLEPCGAVGRATAAEGKPVVPPLQSTAQPESFLCLLTAALWAGRMADQVETPVPRTDVRPCCP